MYDVTWLRNKYQQFHLFLSPTNLHFSNAGGQSRRVRVTISSRTVRNSAKGSGHALAGKRYVDLCGKAFGKTMIMPATKNLGRGQKSRVFPSLSKF
jgi:hypothetical protein